MLSTTTSTSRRWRIVASCAWSGWAVRTMRRTTCSIIVAQGSQYISEDFQRKLAGVGITCSMSRSGNVRDNAVTESFFSALKRERCHRRRYATRDEARADIFDYVERFYYPIRQHSMLGNMSMIAFKGATAGDVA